MDVVNHYDDFFDLALTVEEKTNLVEYLKSLGDEEVIVSVGENSTSLIPLEYNLYQNFPNPFNPTTIIKYELNKQERIVIDIYSINGEHVKRLVDQMQNAGTHEIKWDGKNDKGKLVSSGIYLYQLVVDNQQLSKKMMFLK